MHQYKYLPSLWFMAVIIIGLISSCTKEKIPLDSYLEGYKKWRKPYTKVLDYPVPGHGDTYRIIYANKIAFDPDITREKGLVKGVYMKDGSVIVKEVYVKKQDIGKKEPELTYMVKDKDQSRAHNEWLYILKKPGEDPILVTGRMCVGCHEAANEKHPYFDGNKDAVFRDYLFVPFTGNEPVF